MEPVKFPQSTYDLVKPDGMTDEECGSLPAWTDGKQVVSCWSMSLGERLQALLFGRVWLVVLSGTSQPPVSLQASKEFFTE